MSNNDTWSGKNRGVINVDSVVEEGIAVSPSDTVNLTKPCRALYVGVTGDISVVSPGGSEVIYKNVPVGIFPVRASRVNDTGTDADEIVALY